TATVTSPFFRCSRALPPSDASATTVNSGCASMIRRNPCRKIGWSSAIRTRISLPMPWLPVTRAHTYPHGHGRPTARARFDRVCPAQHVHAFCEPLQTKATAIGRSGAQRVGGKPLAVVPNRDLDVMLMAVHGDVGLVRSG